MEGTLNHRLYKINLEANEMLEIIITRISTETGVDGDLEKSFSDEQKEIFEKFHDCWSEYMSLAEAAILEYAFKLGARSAIEVQRDEE